MTSDTGAIAAISGAHRYNRSAAAAVTAALAAGCDINSGAQYSHNIEAAVKSGMLNESLVDAALINAFVVRIRLGLFDSPEDQPKYPPEVVNSPAHQELSRDASRQAMTLLSNRPITAPSTTALAGEPVVSRTEPDSGGVLPLKQGSKIAVIGPHGDTKALMVGGTGAVLDSALIVCKGATDHNDWRCVDSPYDAIAAVNGPGLTTVSSGASIHPEREANSTLSQMMMQAVATAAKADVVVFVIGDDWETEHETHDRRSIELPGNQNELVANVAAAVGPNVPLVSVLVHGSSLDISTILNYSHAVVDTFYPGIYGARALAETLFGLAIPGGKLPWTCVLVAHRTAVWSYCGVICSSIALPSR